MISAFTFFVPDECGMCASLNPGTDGPTNDELTVCCLKAVVV